MRDGKQRREERRKNKITFMFEGTCVAEIGNHSGPANQNEHNIMSTVTTLNMMSKLEQDSHNDKN